MKQLLKTGDVILFVAGAGCRYLVSGKFLCLPLVTFCGLFMFTHKVTDSPSGYGLIKGGVRNTSRRNMAS